MSQLQERVKKTLLSEVLSTSGSTLTNYPHLHQHTLLNQQNKAGRFTIQTFLPIGFSTFFSRHFEDGLRSWL